MNIEVERFKNNFRVLFAPDENSPSVSILVLVKVGSRYEDSRTSGLAHFVEHMFFKGTTKRPTSKIIGMDIEKIGGTSNAFTSYDYTGYSIKVPKENFEKALEIMSDMLQDGLFEESEILKESGVIIEEIRMYEDRPMSKVRENWYSNIFKDSPLGRDIAGSIDTVSNFHHEDFVTFVKEHYVGEQMLLIISGGFDPVSAKELSRVHFEKTPKGKMSTFPHFTSYDLKPTVSNVCKPIEQSHLILGGFSPKRGYENRYVLKVINSLLSEGFGSRLFQVIRDELGLAYYVYSTFHDFDDVGAFYVGMGVENSKVTLAVDAVMKEIRSLVKGDFVDEEIERAKNYLLGNLVTEIETSDDIAIWHGVQELLLEQIDSIEFAKTEIKKVNREMIVDEMQKVFNSKSFLLAGVTPHQSLPQDLEGILTI